MDTGTHFYSFAQIDAASIANLELGTINFVFEYNVYGTYPSQ